MLRLTEIVGHASDPELAERLHQMEHDGVVERIHLSRTDLQRRRQRVLTDRGNEVALMLDRGSALDNGSVLLLEPARAVVVVLDEPEWLVLRASHAAGALELGYFAGNMHWKVRFEGSCLWVPLEGPREGYVKRLAHLIARGDAEIIDAPALPAGGVRYLAVPHAH